MEESLVSSYVLYQQLFLKSSKYTPVRVRSLYNGEMHYWVEFQLKSNYWVVQERDKILPKDVYYAINKFQIIQMAQNGIFVECFTTFPKDSIERLRPFMLPCTSEDVIKSFVLYQKFDLKKKDPIRVRGYMKQHLHYWVEVQNPDKKWFVYDLKDPKKPIIMNRREYYTKYGIFYVQIAECGIFKEVFECFEPDDLPRLKEHVDPRCVFYTLSKQTYLIYDTAEDSPHTDTRFRKIKFIF